MLPGALKRKLARNAAEAPPKRSAGKSNAPLVAKAKRKSLAHQQRPLTIDEINQLQESSTQLTNENVFTLQLEEILRVSQTPLKYTRFMVGFMPALNEFLLALDSDESSAAVSPPLGIPFDATGLQLPPVVQFRFIAPTAPAMLYGSAACECAVGPLFHVDVHVDMPAACFQRDDHLNLAYQRKRALYAHRLATELAGWSRTDTVRLTFDGGDPLRPCIVTRPPKHTGLRRLFINVRVGAEQNAFKLGRFLPETSNVRGALFGQPPGAELHATPHYNANVLADLTRRQNAQFLQRTLAGDQHRAVRDALVLLKLWLWTRGMRIAGLVLRAFAVHLLKTRRLHASMGAYDVLRQLWTQLAASQWHETAADGAPVALAPQLPASVSPVTMHANYDVVLLDVTGYRNLAADLRLDDYLRLRHESATALDFIERDATITNFRHLFTGMRPTYQQYDHLLNIDGCAARVLHFAADAARSAAERERFEARRHDFAGRTQRLAVECVTAVLRQGFGARILGMTVVERVTGPELAGWRPDEVMPATALGERTLTLGLLLDAQHCGEVLERGPQADQQLAAEAFRAFWGERSQMRRFQDGTVVEACVWAGLDAPVARRRLICRDIAVHLLRLHFGMEGNAVRYVAGQLDVAYAVDVRKLTPAVRTTFGGQVLADLNAEHLSLAVVQSFDELGRQLRALDDLPLAVTDVTGASPVFRYCEVEPVLAQASSERTASGVLICQSYAVLDAVLELSPSGRWPDDLQALRRLKAAFALRIAAALRDQQRLVARTNGRHVDVIKDGYHFRLRIVLGRELMLLKRTVLTNGAVAYRDNDASRAYERQMVRLPRLTVLLHSLYHRAPAFGPAVLIAKRWLRAQLIDAGLWPDECSELLMAALFERTDAWTVPVQPQTAFVRWLHLLATANWHSELVVLNFGQGLSEAQIERLERRFHAERSTFPALCVVSPAVRASAVADAADDEWTVWTGDQAPSGQCVARVAMLAAHSLNLWERGLWSTNPAADAVQKWFVPSLRGYDALIRLRRGKVQQTALREFRGPAATGRKRRAGGGRRVDEAPPASDFNVVDRFVQRLRQAYDEFAVFFYDPCGGDVVGVVWRPAVRVLREFSTSGIAGCREVPTFDAGSPRLYECNLEQLLEDFRIIGHGLVETITTGDEEPTSDAE